MFRIHFHVDKEQSHMSNLLRKPVGMIKTFLKRKCVKGKIWLCSFSLLKLVLIL